MAVKGHTYTKTGPKRLPVKSRKGKKRSRAKTEYLRGCPNAEYIHGYYRCKALTAPKSAPGTPRREYAAVFGTHSPFSAHKTPPRKSPRSSGRKTASRSEVRSLFGSTPTPDLASIRAGHESPAASPGSVARLLFGADTPRKSPPKRRSGRTRKATARYSP
jgi:hypothetical protein